MSMNDTFKPCPFCGETPVWDGNDYGIYLYCPGCGMRGVKIPRWDKSGRQKAAKHWNTRKGDTNAD